MRWGRKLGSSPRSIIDWQSSVNKVERTAHLGHCGRGPCRPQFAVACGEEVPELEAVAQAEATVQLADALTQLHTPHVLPQPCVPQLQPAHG